MKNKTIKFRVFDSKGNYQQSYSGEIVGGFNWAKDCAKRMSGYIVEHVFEDEKEISSSVIFDLRDK